jgi:hypothetical protein
VTTNTADNGRRFDGGDEHNITPAGQDLSNVAFSDENGTYNQLSNLTASQQIRMYGGVWNANGYDVN